MKIGLVLEGGAMRGMYTAGVLDTFLKENVSVDKIVGVSAGALFGVNFLSNQPGRVIRYNCRFNSDKNYMGIRPLLREGNVISTEYAYGRVPKELDRFDDDTFKKAVETTPFYAVVTNIKTGLPEYISLKSVFDQMDVLRASGSMPFVSKPVSVDGDLCLDGALADSIPFEWMMSQGCDRLIVVLTRDSAYRKKPMKALPAKLLYRPYPKLVERIINRHDMYNRSVDKLASLEREGKVFVIRPSRPIDIKRTETDPDRLRQVYDLGLSDTSALLPKLREYLK